MAALRQPARQLCLGRPKQLSVLTSASASTSLSFQRHRGLATAVQAPPVTQNNHGSKGPTAMVFLNMGGPSTTDEVGDFLSRLFVSAAPKRRFSFFRSPHTNLNPLFSRPTVI